MYHADLTGQPVLRENDERTRKTLFEKKAKNNEGIKAPAKHNKLDMKNLNFSGSE